MKKAMSLVGKWACLILMLVISSCSTQEEKASPEIPPEKNPVAEIHTVEISQMKFFPAEITVKKGDKIVFVNRDIVAHDVTEEETKAWSSAPLQTEQTWMMVAEKSANYFCSIHPVMKGRIIVQ